MKLRTALMAGILLGVVVCAQNALRIHRRVADLRHEIQVQQEGRSRAEAQIAVTTAALKQSEQATGLAVEAVELARRERQSALAEAALQNHRSENLVQELTETRLALAGAQTELVHLRSLPVEQLANLPARVEELRAELNKVRKENIFLNRVLWNVNEKLPVELCKWSMPEDLKGKVVAVDPKWGFFVLDAGEDQGVLGNGELLVSRSGRLVAKVRIKDAHKNYSIARVVPGWGLGEILEGDSFTTFSE